MKPEDVPQDQISTLSGQKKKMYVRTQTGEYGTALSSGWDAEEVVLEQAITEFTAACLRARQNVQAGISSPLEFHMYQHRMDITLLAQATGFFRWQVRRHLRPAIFSRLSLKKLQRYQEALQLSREQLQSLPQE